MYSSKTVGPTMKPWGNQPWTGYSWENFPSRTNQNCLSLRKDQIKPNIRSRFEFLKKTSMPKPDKNLRYIKWQNSRSPRPIISHSNCIRDNCQKICSWSRRPENLLEIRKKADFLRWPTSLLFRSFSKIWLTTERRLTGR